MSAAANPLAYCVPEPRRVLMLLLFQHSLRKTWIRQLAFLYSQLEIYFLLVKILHELRDIKINCDRMKKKIYLMELVAYIVKGDVSWEIARSGIFQRTLDSNITAEGLSVMIRTFASHSAEEPMPPSWTYKHEMDERWNVTYIRKQSIKILGDVRTKLRICSEFWMLIKANIISAPFVRIIAQYNPIEGWIEAYNLPVSEALQIELLKH